MPATWDTVTGTHNAPGVESGGVTSSSTDRSDLSMGAVYRPRRHRREGDTIRYLTNREQQRRKPRSVWKWGKGAAVCPRCRQKIKPGQWVKHASGKGFVIRHAYSCPRSR